MVSKIKVQNILSTLPIGYYVGRNVPVELVDGDKSYYMLVDDKICIGYDMMARVLDEIDSSNEDDIRAVLYHELSHAILTPKCIECEDIYNIFEDERIETILSKYYLNVDFKSFVKKLNGFDGTFDPKSAKEAFYSIVRFRTGPKYLVDEVDRLIHSYRRLNSSSRNTYSYEYEIDKFYEEVEKWFGKHSKESSSKKHDSSDSPDSSDASSMIDDSIVTDEKSDISDDICAKDLVRRVANKYVDVKLIDKVNQILQRLSASNKHNGSAINSYSGKFDYRSVVRDDYKYFVQKNRLGNAKRFGKIHMNLFIDESGSFCDSDDTINSLMHALAIFEKKNPDFSFDLISCGMGERIRDKNDRLQRSNGGNALTDEIHDIFKKMQFNDQKNINIVCFDGDAFSDCPANKNFSAFNHSNCIIISDYSNQSKINRDAKSAKRIFTPKYTEQLIDNVLKSLQSVF